MSDDFPVAISGSSARGGTPRRPGLSQADVARLLTDPSAETRAETASKIAADFTEAELNPAERRMAQEIFRALVKDAALIVREALAEQLKHAPNLPHDLVAALVADADSVALPMLRSSEALTDADLLDVVREAAPRRVTAVAQRQSVSPEVCEAVIDTGQAEAVAELVGNEGAAIAEADFQRVLEEFAEQPAVGDQLARRAQVPAAVAEQLVARLSARLQEVLAARGDLDADNVADLVLQVRERALLQLADQSRDAQELDRLVAALAKRGRLTDSLVLRALCAGDLAFFETAMAELAKVPVPNARILIYDEGKLGLVSLYKRAGLPDSKLKIFKVAVAVARETEYDGGPNDRARFASRLLERLLTVFDKDADWPDDDLEYLVDRLARTAA